jgi:hypothetical protein
MLSIDPLESDSQLAHRFSSRTSSGQVSMLEPIHLSNFPVDARTVLDPISPGAKIPGGEFG